MIPPETYLWRQTVIGSSSTVGTSSGSGAVASVNSEGPVLNYSTLPAGRVFARQTSAMRFATSVAAAASGAMASTVSWPAMVPSIFRPFTLSRTLETAPAVPSRGWTTTWVCAGTRPRSRSEIKRSIRSCLVVLSTGDIVAPKIVLLRKMLEPEVLLVAERQVHVLYCRTRGALEQVVDRREEQQLPCPAVYRSREPAPVGVGHVRDVRVHLPHTSQNSLDLRRVPVPRRPIGACTLVHADEVRLYTRLRPCSAHPG